MLPIILSTTTTIKSLSLSPSLSHYLSYHVQPLLIDGGCQEGPTNINGGESAFLGQALCQERSEDLTERDILELLYDQCGGVGWHTRQ
jgi:hypothetical protein